MALGAPFRHTLARLIFAILACALASTLITGRPVIKDASETLTMAINLEHHGVISMDESAPYRPSMMREPLPIVIDAVAVWVLDAVQGRASLETYFSGARARDLKLQN